MWAFHWYQNRRPWMTLNQQDCRALTSALARLSCCCRFGLFQIPSSDKAGSQNFRFLTCRENLGGQENGCSCGWGSSSPRFCWLLADLPYGCARLPWPISRSGPVPCQWWKHKTSWWDGFLESHGQWGRISCAVWEHKRGSSENQLHRMKVSERDLERNRNVIKKLVFGCVY